MAIKQNQHYVPRVYLKEFTDSNKQFWRYKLNTSKPSLRLVTPEQICYKPDYYTINSQRTLKEYSLEDENSLEKQFSKSFEVKYNSIIKEIKSHRDYILAKHAAILINGILEIKMRNDAIRKIISPNALRQIFDRHINLTIPQLQEIEINGEPNLIEALHREKEKFISNEENLKDLHLRMLIDINSNKDPLVRQIADFLLKSEWFIFTAPPTHLFITSDNPGFCIDCEGREQLHNMKFSGQFIFNFPLTPLHTLIIHSSLEDNKSDNLFKKIHYKNATKEFITTINLGSLVNSNENVFSFEKGKLLQLIQQLKGFNKA